MMHQEELGERADSTAALSGNIASGRGPSQNATSAAPWGLLLECSFPRRHARLSGGVRRSIPSGSGLASQLADASHQHWTIPIRAVFVSGSSYQAVRIRQSIFSSKNEPGESVSDMRVSFL